MTTLSPDNIESLTVSAIRAAAYLDACDAGASMVRLDPDYYQACGKVLREIFALLDPHLHFPVLLEESAAAREMAESLSIGRRIGISRLGYYPELAVVINRAAV
ncbi:MAG: hypothetical protein F9K30_06390 [Dechloromonas sp.]|nr:MAG: hypothetical protein F9K30_06390 [Dechloromonas sp.]